MYKIVLLDTLKQFCDTTFVWWSFVNKKDLKNLIIDKNNMAEQNDLCSHAEGPAAQISQPTRQGINVTQGNKKLPI